jgi:hypothetical protein
MVEEKTKKKSRRLRRGEWASVGRDGRRRANLRARVSWE